MSTEMYANRTVGVENQMGAATPLEVVNAEALAAEQGVELYPNLGDEVVECDGLNEVEADEASLTIDGLRGASSFLEAINIYAKLLPEVNVLPSEQREHTIRELDRIMLNKRLEDRKKSV